MTNQQVEELIQEYDAGRRDGVIQLKVYHALINFAPEGLSSEAEDIEEGGFEDEAALQCGIEWLRRKMRFNHLNAFN